MCRWRMTGIDRSGSGDQSLDASHRDTTISPAGSDAMCQWHMTGIDRSGSGDQLLDASHRDAATFFKRLAECETASHDLPKQSFAKKEIRKTEGALFGPLRFFQPVRTQRDQRHSASRKSEK